MKQNKTKVRGRKSKEEFLKIRQAVITELYRSYVLDLKGRKNVTLEYQDIEKLWKVDRRTSKQICRHISDFCTFVELYERGIQVDRSTFFRSNLGRDHKIKVQIAHRLCELLSEYPVNSLAFGPGSTTAICAQVLAEENKLPNVVLTNSFGAYDVLRGYQTTDLILTGGKYKATIHACVGRGAVDGFRNARCEASVMGVSAINMEGQLLVKHYDETDVLKQMLWSTSERIFIVTSIQKFVSRDTFPVVKIQELLEKTSNVEVNIITNSITDLEDVEKKQQAADVTDALINIGEGKRVRIIQADGSDNEKDSKGN